MDQTAILSDPFRITCKTATAHPLMTTTTTTSESMSIIEHGLHTIPSLQLYSHTEVG